MSELKIIEQREVLGKEFRVYGDFDDPLFLAKDVAEWIEHSDVSMMLFKIDDEEKLIQAILVSGQNRQCWFLTEDGLYEVLMQSRKPIAKQFKKQVKAILKEIRKNGHYNTVKLTEKETETLEMKEIIKRAMDLKAKMVNDGCPNEEVEQIVRAFGASHGLLFPEIFVRAGGLLVSYGNGLVKYIYVTDPPLVDYITNKTKKIKVISGEKTSLVIVH